MNPKLATHWPWTALFCAALSGCDSPPPAPSTTPAVVVPTPTPCPLEGMPFMVSETGTRPEADLLVEPNKRNPFRTSASYGNLDLTFVGRVGDTSPQCGDTVLDRDLDIPSCLTKERIRGDRGLYLPCEDRVRLDERSRILIC